MVKDINWLRKQLHYCNKYTDQQILLQTIVDINIHIARINSKHGTHIEYINNTWNYQWHNSTKKEHYALNHMLKQEHKKLEEQQIKTSIDNCNKAIDREERKFITSLLNRDKRTIIIDRVRSVITENTEILYMLPDEVKTEATNIFSNQF